MTQEVVAIVTCGYFPIPAIKGGAVEALVENIINENEVEGKLKLVVFSTFDEKASVIADHYEKTRVIYIKTPRYLKLVDKFIFFLANDVIKKEKSLSYRYICQRLWFILCTARYLKKNNYDKVLLENHSSLYLVLKLFNNHTKYRGKYYYHLHNNVTSSYRCNEIMKNTTSVLGVSNYINGTLRDFLGESNIHYQVLRNRIDNEKFRVELTKDEKLNIKEKYGINPNDKIILFAGRLSPEKGVKELLTAFNKIKRNDMTLLVVGSHYFGSDISNSFEEEIKGLVESIKDKVKFTGYVDYSFIPKLYAIADIVVIPSIWDDPAPLTVIESLSAGRPLITTYSGGIPEYANSEVAIMIQKEKIVDSLKTSIEELINDEEMRKTLSEKAYKYTDEWTISAYYNDFVREIGN